jgi:hypothetical protein
MSDAKDEVERDEENEVDSSKSKDQRSQSKDLDRVTDYSEEAEILDSGKAQQVR